MAQRECTSRNSVTDITFFAAIAFTPEAIEFGAEICRRQDCSMFRRRRPSQESGFFRGGVKAIKKLGKNGNSGTRVWFA